MPEFWANAATVATLFKPDRPWLFGPPRYEGRCARVRARGIRTNHLRLLELQFAKQVGAGGGKAIAAIGIGGPSLEG